MRVQRSSGSSLRKIITTFTASSKTRRRLLATAAVVLTALAPAYAQQGGVAGTALAAAAEVQPPPLAQFPAEPMPPLAATAPVVPTLAPQPAVAAKRPEAAKKLDAKYDVSKIGDRGVGRGLDFYSLERERAMGRELAQQVESESHMIKDPVITEYINRVGQRIVRNSDARVPFTIKVIDDDEINAFALPGGYFYVNTGLIMAADNEAELAGVMAHEIAHVAARHATKNATKMQILNLVSIPMIFIGGPVGYAVRQVAGLAVPMSFLKFSRDAEREADLLGLEYEYACGYDPEEFVKFFEKLKLQQKQKHSFLAKAFNTHPMTSDRIRRAQEEIADYLPAKNEYVVDTSEFEQVKARLANLMNEQKIGSGTGYPAPPTLRKRPHDTVSTGEKPGGDSSRSGKPPTLRHP